MVKPLSLSVGDGKVLTMPQFEISKDFIRFASLSHAFFMAANLPRYINSKIEPILQIASLEDWFVNMRLLIEFFRLNSNGNPKDFSIETFSVSANCPPEMRKEMNEIWLIASRHVVHFSDERTVVENNENYIFDSSNSNLKRLVADLILVATNFQKQLSALDHEQAIQMRAMLEQAELSLSELGN